VNRVVSFKANINPSLDIPANQSHPIYDEYGSLVGAFNIKEEGAVIGFLSTKGYELSLEISLGEPFYITLNPGDDGKIEKGLVTRNKIGINSAKISKIEESL
jgi:hypothetical protein